MNRYIIFIVMLLISTLIGYGLYTFLSRKIIKRKNKFLARLDNPETREKALEELNSSLEVMHNRLYYYLISKIVLSLILLFLGITGTYYLIEKIVTNSFSTIFDEYNYDFYFFSPILLVIGTISIVINIKELVHYKKTDES